MEGISEEAFQRLANESPISQSVWMGLIRVIGFLSRSQWNTACCIEIYSCTYESRGLNAGVIVNYRGKTWNRYARISTRHSYHQPINTHGHRPPAADDEYLRFSSQCFNQLWRLQRQSVSFGILVVLLGIICCISHYRIYRCFGFWIRTNRPDADLFHSSSSDIYTNPHSFCPKNPRPWQIRMVRFGTILQSIPLYCWWRGYTERLRPPSDE